MTHPERHLIVGSSVSGEWRPRVTMLDFERCTRAKTGKQRNVTQTAQFFGSQRLRTLLAGKGILVDVDALRVACKGYKQALSHVADSGCSAAKHDGCDDYDRRNDAVMNCVPICVAGICAALGCDATK